MNHYTVSCLILLVMLQGINFTQAKCIREQSGSRIYNENNGTSKCSWITRRFQKDSRILNITIKQLDVDPGNALFIYGNRITPEDKQCIIVIPPGSSCGVTETITSGCDVIEKNESFAVEFRSFHVKEKLELQIRNAECVQDAISIQPQTTQSASNISTTTMRSHSAAQHTISGASKETTPQEVASMSTSRSTTKSTNSSYQKLPITHPGISITNSTTHSYQTPHIEYSGISSTNLTTRSYHKPRITYPGRPRIGVVDVATQKQFPTEESTAVIIKPPDFFMNNIIAIAACLLLAIIISAMVSVNIMRRRKRISKHKVSIYPSAIKVTIPSISSCQNDIGNIEIAESIGQSRRVDANIQPSSSPMHGMNKKPLTTFQKLESNVATTSNREDASPYVTMGVAMNNKLSHQQTYLDMKPAFQKLRPKKQLESRYVNLVLSPKLNVKFKVESEYVVMTRNDNGDNTFSI